MLLRFIKMQGLGNDFIVIDDLAASTPLTPAIAVKICDRRFGIGADQILWLKKSSNADARMEILNADGSTAEMCGNGIRAVALYLNSKHPKKTFRIDTLAGLKTVEVAGDLVNVDMGAPVVGEGAITAGGREMKFTEVNMGNPHVVFFTDDVAGVPLEKIGPEIEKHSRFPQKTNVEFVQILNDHAIRVRVWERGAGITLACGTGACASAVAAIESGKVHGEVEVQLPGGNLLIRWDGSVFMKGPAKEVFRGEISV